MQLRTYLKRWNLTHLAFAELVGTSQQMVSRWVSGERSPRKVVIAKIHRLTRGKVTLFDWIKNES